MPKLEWSETLSVGDDEIDQQHRSIFELHNRLVDAQAKGRSRKMLSDAFADLHDYTQHHFRCEEDLMRRCGYPFLEDHILLHSQLIRKLRRFQEAFQLGRTRVTERFLEFLTYWLSKHCGEMDLSYADCLAKGDRQTTAG